jgi:hypothetical protein
MSQPETTNIIYVNVNNSSPVQNGLSWKTAYSSLQVALNDAATRITKTEIWIAQGNYIPTQIYSPNGVPGGAYGVTTVNLLTFNLPNHVSLFGGFCGNEKELCQRDIYTHPTILNGIGVSWHVVIAGNDVAKTGVDVSLDGLTITGGNANGPLGFTPIFEPLNYAHSYGAGLYVIFGSTVRIKNVTFISNSAGGTGGVGGGIMSNNSNIYISKSLFRNNTAAEEGGGVEILNTYETSPHISVIQSSLFSENMAADFGGAIVAEGTLQNTESRAEIRNCIFEKNSSQVGGAIAVDSIRVIIDDTTFTSNTSAVAGGAVSEANIVNILATTYHGVTFTPYPTTISNSTFCSNVAAGNVLLHDVLLGGLSAGLDFPLGGGALTAYFDGYLDVSTSTFQNNESQNSNGGAILNGRAAAVNPLGIPVSAFFVETKVRDCTFINNKALAGQGSAIASQPSTFPFLPPPPITLASTVLQVVKSKFVASCKESVIYLNMTTACLQDNCLECSEAKRKNAIVIIDSTVTSSCP